MTYAINININNVIITYNNIILQIYVVINKYRPNIGGTKLIMTLCELEEYNTTYVNKNYIRYDCYDRTPVRYISNKPLKLEWIYV